MVNQYLFEFPFSTLFPTFLSMTDRLDVEKSKEKFSLTYSLTDVDVIKGEGRKHRIIRPADLTAHDVTWHDGKAKAKGMRISFLKQKKYRGSIGITSNMVKGWKLKRNVACLFY